jgi:hypothetical protein
MKQKYNAINIRTHGGLGNQLFQVFYGLLLSQGQIERLRIIHDSDYPHGFEICEKLKHLEKSTYIEKCISNLRIGKIIEKATSKIAARMPILNNYYDGYFQEAKIYQNFDSNERYTAIKILKKIFEIDSEGLQKNPSLHHIRLGDFFSENEKKKDHVKSRLTKLPENSHIITNEEDLVQDQIREINRSDILLIKTAKNKDYELLKLMTTYHTIYSNNSTIALWASILGNCDLKISDPKLEQTYRLIVCDKD